jgi:hypothetical protein
MRRYQQARDEASREVAARNARLAALNPPAERILPMFLELAAAEQASDELRPLP